MVNSEYNDQQLEAFSMVRKYLDRLSPSELSSVKRRIRSYLHFRKEVADFQAGNFALICNAKCFASRTSACCNREGIATFFADIIINVLVSSDEEIENILRAIREDPGGYKCVYLTKEGCLWSIKPIVCEMFLCANAKHEVLEGDQKLSRHWKKLREREKYYTWPNRPVLFDELEEMFIRKGYDSPLMYFHKSPGLLRIKKGS